MAIDQTLNSFFAKLPEGFPIDKASTEAAWKNWATFNERLANLAIDTASRSNEIATKTTQESLASLRDLTKVHEEPSEYGQAFVKFVEGQASLTRDTAEAFGKVLVEAREQAAAMLSEAGEEAKKTGEANTKAAVRKTTAKAKQAAKETEAAVAETA